MHGCEEVMLPNDINIVLLNEENTALNPVESTKHQPCVKDNSSAGSKPEVRTGSTFADDNGNGLKNSYGCNVCSKTYLSKRALDRHLREFHPLTMPFNCEVCVSGFKTAKGLKCHQKISCKVDCDWCFRRFKSRYALWYHRSWCKERREYSCDVCKAQFKFLSELRHHKEVHFPELSNSLQNGNISRGGNDFLLQHELNWLPEDQLFSRTLEAGPTTPSSVRDGSLLRKYYTHATLRSRSELYPVMHGSEEAVLPNDISIKLLDEENNALSPVESAILQPRVEYVWSNFVGNNNNNKDKKNNNNNNNNNNININKNSNGVNNNNKNNNNNKTDNMDNNNRNSNGIINNNNNDNNCHSNNNNNNSNSDDVKKDRNVCNICSKIYLSRSGFFIHVSKEHSSVMPYICETCGFGFKTTEGIKRHQEVYCKGASIECEYCGKRYKSETGLKYHSPWCEAKSFSCHICKERFKYESELVHHQEGHLGVHM